MSPDRTEEVTGNIFATNCSGHILKQLLLPLPSKLNLSGITGVARESCSTQLPSSMPKKPAAVVLEQLGQLNQPNLKQLNCGLRGMGTEIVQAIEDSYESIK